MAASSEYARVLLQTAFDGRGNGTLLDSIKAIQSSISSGQISSASGNGISTSFFAPGTSPLNKQLTAQLARDTYTEALANGFTDDAAGVDALFAEIMWQLEPCSSFEARHTLASTYYV